MPLPCCRPSSRLSAAAWLAALVSTACCGFAAAEAVRPNVLIILVDDLGYGDLACQPHVKEPVLSLHLDRLAAEGVRLTQA